MSRSQAAPAAAPATAGPAAAGRARRRGGGARRGGAAGRALRRGRGGGRAPAATGGCARAALAAAAARRARRGGGRAGAGARGGRRQALCDGADGQGWCAHPRPRRRLLDQRGRREQAGSLEPGRQGAPPRQRGHELLVAGLSRCTRLHLRGRPCMEQSNRRPGGARRARGPTTRATRARATPPIMACTPWVWAATRRSESRSHTSLWRWRWP
ncbi:unnamed protein product [Prorocentrum cordatum]|uniref:Uncharacterized protein n=1 Tax=Prorocentrum cordatum TaxID=2364126 RepID=A0ABN9U5W1_9DINO|nr:unnamed protein product [Polarella glacialis]